MTLLIAGLLVFLGIHSISIFALPLRNRLAAKNVYGWKAIYSLVALLGLVMVIKGYADYRLVAPVLYFPPTGLRHLAALLLLPVFVLLLAPYFPSRLNRIIRNPQLTAVKLWAVSHLLVNGSAADLILFLAFIAWAVADVISVKRRPVRPVPHLPESKTNLFIVIIGGLVLYVVFAGWLHGVLIGVRPFG